jgi:hypothetical protein
LKTKQAFHANHTSLHLCFTQAELLQIGDIRVWVAVGFLELAFAVQTQVLDRYGFLSVPVLFCSVEFFENREQKGIEIQGKTGSVSSKHQAVSTGRPVRHPTWHAESPETTKPTENSWL